VADQLQTKTDVSTGGTVYLITSIYEPVLNEILSPMICLDNRIPDIRLHK